MLLWSLVYTPLPRDPCERAVINLATARTDYNPAQHSAGGKVPNSFRSVATPGRLSMKRSADHMDICYRRKKFMYSALFSCDRFPEPLPTITLFYTLALQHRHLPAGLSHPVCKVMPHILVPSPYLILLTPSPYLCSLPPTLTSYPLSIPYPLPLPVTETSTTGSTQSTPCWPVRSSPR